MDNQTALNTATAKLIEQGRVSYDLNRGCLYRDGQGGCCGIGHLIPDEIYTTEIEGNDICTLLSLDDFGQAFPEVADHFIDVDIGLLEGIQSAHDDIVGGWCDEPLIGDAFRKAIAESMATLAADYGLETPPAAIPFLTPDS